MGPYEESKIEFFSIRDSVLRRPSMFLGDLLDGSAYACIVQTLVHATLSWQIGANVGVKLKANNAVELFCYRGLPQGEKAHVHRWGRPIHILTREFALFGNFGLEFCSVACRQMTWKIQDASGAGAASFQDGVCCAASESAPDLHEKLCLRVLLAVGTSAIQIAPATVDQVTRAIRYLSGPAEAGYWGCVSIDDLRTGEKRSLLVTDPPPGPNWLQT